MFVLPAEMHLHLQRKGKPSNCEIYVPSQRQILKQSTPGSNDLAYRSPS